MKGMSAKEVGKYRNGAINSRSWKVTAPLTFQTKTHFLGRQKRPNSYLGSFSFWLALLFSF